MKKIIVLFAFIAFAFIAEAANEISYVVVNGKAYFSHEAKANITGIKLDVENGMTMKIPFKKVDLYCIDGKVFERLPVTATNGKERGTALLELVAFRNGFRLYRYASSDNTLGCCFSDESGNTSMYFIYKEGELYLRADNQSIDNLLSFFGKKAIHENNQWE